MFSRRGEAFQKLHKSKGGCSELIHLDNGVKGAQPHESSSRLVNDLVSFLFLFARPRDPDLRLDSAGGAGRGTAASRPTAVAA